MALQSAVDVVPFSGAIAGCHCRVLWWGEESVTTNFGGVDVVHCRVPLQGVLWLGRSAIAGCIVVCYGGEGGGDDQLWRSGRSAIGGCHCGVLWGSGRSAIAGCHCRVPL